MTLAARILALLANGRERTPDELAERTGAARPLVVATLETLRREGKLVSKRIAAYDTAAYRLASPPAGRQKPARRLTAVPPPGTATPATGQKMGVTR